MCRLYHISQVCKEPSRLNYGLNRKRSFTLEGEILIDLRKEHKSMLKGKDSSLKWQEMQINEWIREQFLSEVHFPNVKVVDRERFTVRRCHNPGFSINKDAPKGVFLFECFFLSQSSYYSITLFTMLLEFISSSHFAQWLNRARIFRKKQ